MTGRPLSACWNAGTLQSPRRDGEKPQWHLHLQILNLQTLLCVHACFLSYHNLTDVLNLRLSMTHARLAALAVMIKGCMHAPICEEAARCSASA